MIQLWPKWHAVVRCIRKCSNGNTGICVYQQNLWWRWPLACMRCRVELNMRDTAPHVWHGGHCTMEIIIICAHVCASVKHMWRYVFRGLCVCVPSVKCIDCTICSGAQTATDQRQTSYDTCLTDMSLRWASGTSLVYAVSWSATRRANRCCARAFWRQKEDGDDATHAETSVRLPRSFVAWLVVLGWAFYWCALRGPFVYIGINTTAMVLMCTTQR